MRPIISCTVSLMYPISVWTDSKFQQVEADMPAYFMYSKALKEQLTTMDLTSIIMLITADVTSMYTNIQTRPALNQIVQYLNGNKTKYQNIPVNYMLRALCLIMKNNIFCFVDRHWLKLKGIAMGTPPTPTYATFFYGVSE